MWHIFMTRWKILWQPDYFWRCDQCLLLHELEGELPACTASSSLRRVREICHCALIVWASSYHIMIQHTIPYHEVPYHNIPYHCLLAYTVFSPIHILQAPWTDALQKFWQSPFQIMLNTVGKESIWYLHFEFAPYFCISFCICTARDLHIRSC